MTIRIEAYSGDAENTKSDPFFVTVYGKSASGAAVLKAVDEAIVQVRKRKADLARRLKSVEPLETLSAGKPDPQIVQPKKDL